MCVTVIYIYNSSILGSSLNLNPSTLEWLDDKKKSISWRKTILVLRIEKTTKNK
jgi:hypothetical protein